MHYLTAESSTYRVRHPMDPHGILLLTAPSAERVFHVVTYEDTPLRTQLQQATRGDMLHLNLERVEGRASVYRATREPDHPVTTENRPLMPRLLQAALELLFEPQENTTPRHSSRVSETDTKNDIQPGKTEKLKS